MVFWIEVFIITGDFDLRLLIIPQHLSSMIFINVTPKNHFQMTKLDLKRHFFTFVCQLKFSFCLDKNCPRVFTFVSEAKNPVFRFYFQCVLHIYKQSRFVRIADNSLLCYHDEIGRRISHRAVDSFNCRFKSLSLLWTGKRIVEKWHGTTFDSPLDLSGSSRKPR